MATMSQSIRTLFSGTTVVASGPFFYNSAKETAITAGWFSGKYDNVVIQIGCATVVNPLTYRVEGRAANGDRAASLAIGTITGTSTIDKYINITPKFAEIRVGVTSASTVGSPAVALISHKFHCAALLRETT